MKRKIMKYKAVIYLKNGKKINKKASYKADEINILLEKTREHFQEEHVGCLRICGLNVKTSEIVAVDFKRCLL